MNVMTKICVSAENAEDAKMFLEAGADVIAAAVGGCAMSALEDWSMEEVMCFDRITLLMDRLFGQGETRLVDEVFSKLDPSRIEAICFSDPAVVKKAEHYGLKEKLVYRPGMLAVSSEDAAWWLKQGIQAVSIPPLLTREEIISILRKVPGCTVTIHGRLLMSVSGRKLLSAYRDDEDIALDPSSGRLFLQEEKREGKMPVFERESGTYIYTDFIQSSFKDLKLFEEAGAGTFYIESLTLTPEQTVAAVKSVKRVLAGADPEEEENICRSVYGTLERSEGYYGQKTIR